MKELILNDTDYYLFIYFDISSYYYAYVSMFMASCKHEKVNIHNSSSSVFHTWSWSTTPLCICVFSLLLTHQLINKLESD